MNNPKVKNPEMNNLGVKNPAVNNLGINYPGSDFFLCYGGEKSWAELIWGMNNSPSARNNIVMKFFHDKFNSISFFKS